MKNRNHIIRLVILSIISIVLIYLAHQTKYVDNLFFVLIFFGLGFIVLGFWIWTMFKDVKAFKKESRFKTRISIFLGLFVILDIFFIRLRIVNLHDAASLIEIYEVTEYVGTSIDFKKDKTYILQEHDLAGRNYKYGTYQLRADTIILDRKYERPNTKTMLIQPMELDSYEVENPSIQYMVIEMDEYGGRVNNVKYNVVKDNR